MILADAFISTRRFASHIWNVLASGTKCGQCICCGFGRGFPAVMVKTDNSTVIKLKSGFNPGLYHNPLIQDILLPISSSSGRYLKFPDANPSIGSESAQLVFPHSHHFRSPLFIKAPSGTRCPTGLFLKGLSIEFLQHFWEGINTGIPARKAAVNEQISSLIFLHGSIICSSAVYCPDIHKMNHFHSGGRWHHIRIRPQL